MTVGAITLARTQAIYFWLDFYVYCDFAYLKLIAISNSANSNLYFQFNTGLMELVWVQP